MILARRIPAFSSFRRYYWVWRGGPDDQGSQAKRARFPDRHEKVMAASRAGVRRNDPSYRSSQSSLPRGRIMPAGVLLAPFRTGTTHVMELRLIGPRLFDQQRSADIRRNRPCLQSARGKAQRRIREHLIHRHSPIDGDLMIERDVLREICPSRHMFSRGKPRRRYRNLVKERMVDRLPRQGLRPRN
jgi:hypothetical protein